MTWDAETDVLVVGGGGGGLVAALSARESGAQVMVVEKERKLAGNTALSSGSVPGAGSRFQREAGIDDSPELMAADIMRRTDGTAPPELVDVLTTVSGPLVEWLADDVDVPFSFVPDLKKVGHSVPRTHMPPGRHGSILLAGLRDAALARDVIIAPGNAVLRLVDDGERNVLGAVVKAGEHGPEYTARASKVILACNGFGGNKEMLRQYIPEIADAPYFGHHGNTGEGILWGIELGAALRNIGAYQGHASVAYPHGSLLSWTIMEKGGLMVNRAGRRFVNEDDGYSACAASVLAQEEAQAFAIFDERIHDYMYRKVPDFVELVENGGVHRGPDIETPARYFGIDAKQLAATLLAYNRSANERSDPLGRQQFGDAPLRGNFSIVRITAGLFHTQGGLDVNRDSQPIRGDSSVVGNLYAVGGVAVGVSGAHGGKGYCSANGLLAALGLGRVAGLHAGNAVGQATAA